MKILSCNIRYAEAPDGENQWQYRRDFCLDVIRSKNPQIICFQEMHREQFEFISKALVDFEWYGMTDEATNWNPVVSIFSQRDMFLRMSAGGYWLSQTPHIPGTKSWASACVRLANWVRLKETNTGKEFRIVNTHLDHISQPARENQVRIINEDAAAFDTHFPQLLTGDMNCNSQNAAICTFLNGGWQDTYHAIHGTLEPGNTFHGFLGNDYQKQEGKIDWIFTRGNWSVQGAEIIKDHRNGRFPSDHYFIAADVDLK